MIVDSERRSRLQDYIKHQFYAKFVNICNFFIASLQHSPPLPTNYQLLLSATPTLQSGVRLLFSPSVQTKHYLGKTPGSQSSFHNFSIDQLRYWNLQFLLSKQRIVVQTLLCITVKVQLTTTGKLS